MNVIVDRVDDLATKRGFEGARALHSGSGGNVTKVLIYVPLGVFHIYVTRNGERGIVGHVELLVEGHELLEGGCIEVVHGADGNPTVVVLGEGALEHLGQKTSVGLVVYALALFFFNYLALGIYAHLVNFCMQHAL